MRAVSFLLRSRATVTIALTVLILSSCGSFKQLTRGTQYPLMYSEKPVTLLIMPPINNSSFVESKEFLYTSIHKPLAEAGYYVISPKLAMEILRAESAYDAELFVNAPLDKFKKYFGADAVVFSEINSWTKVGFSVHTNIRYFIKSTATGEIIFDRTCNLYLDLTQTVSANSSALTYLVAFAVSAIKTATTDHIVAARKANEFIFLDIPRGKYDAQYGQDSEVTANQKDITTTLRY